MDGLFEFLDHNQGWVGTALGILAGALLSYYFYLRALQGPQLAYHHWTGRVLGARDHKLPDEVKITFRDQPIENLCRTLVLIWNNSYRTVHGENIVKDDPLRIDMGDGVKVLDDRIVKLTRDVNKLGLGALVSFGDLEHVTSTQPIVEFEYLDRGDGCVVEIFHTEGGQPPTVRGSIREMPRGVKNYGQRFPLHPVSYFFEVVFSGAAGAFFIWMGLTQSGVTRAGAPVFVVLGCLPVAFAIWRAITCRRRFPKGLSMPEFVSR